jgi:hypothetical protein
LLACCARRVVQAEGSRPQRGGFHGAGAEGPAGAGLSVRCHGAANCRASGPALSVADAGSGSRATANPATGAPRMTQAAIAHARTRPRSLRLRGRPVASGRWSIRSRLSVRGGTAVASSAGSAVAGSPARARGARSCRDAFGSVILDRHEDSGGNDRRASSGSIARAACAAATASLAVANRSCGRLAIPRARTSSSSGGHVEAMLAQAGWRRVDVRVHDRRVDRPRVGDAARQGVEQHRSERVDVGLRQCKACLELLRRDVGESAKNHPGARQRARA